MSNLFRSMLSVCALFLVIGTLLGCSKEAGAPASKESQKALVVGLNAQYPPFESVNLQGDVEGFDVSLSHLIAQKMSRPLTIKEMSFDALILSLKQGKIDLIISSLSITASRQKEITMIHYYGDPLKTVSLVFWKEIPGNIHSLEDFKQQADSGSKAVVAACSGTLQEEYLGHFAFIQPKALDHSVDLMMDIKYGKSVAALMEPAVAYHLQAKYPDLKILDLTLPESDQILGFGIGVKKGNAELGAEVEKVIEEFKASGEIDKLAKQWFVEKGGDNE